jgi:hypothetical protein
MAIHENIRKSLSEFEFGKIGMCKIKLDESPKAFAFLDHYLDTNDSKILHSNSAYRLRFRWSSFMSYVRHKIFPFSGMFRPTRTEIQAKIGYKKVEKGLSTTETRFEFRKESHPFSEGVELPPSTWKEANYLDIARSGKYMEYDLYPSVELQNIGIEFGQIESRLILLTKRNRMHLNCKSPFGTGPNPEQMFIVTVDRVFCEKGCSRAQKPFVEIEIERERNTSTLIDRVSSYETGEFFSNAKIANSAIDYAKKAKVFFDADHKRLSQIVYSTIESRDYEVKNPTFKYARFSKK